MAASSPREEELLQISGLSWAALLPHAATAPPCTHMHPYVCHFCTWSNIRRLFLLLVQRVFFNDEHGDLGATSTPADRFFTNGLHRTGLQKAGRALFGRPPPVCFLWSTSELFLPLKQSGVQPSVSVFIYPALHIGFRRLLNNPAHPKACSRVCLIRSRRTSVNKCTQLESRGRWNRVYALRWKSILSDCLTLEVVDIDRVLPPNYVFILFGSCLRDVPGVNSDEWRTIMVLLFCYCCSLDKSPASSEQDRNYKIYWAGSSGHTRTEKKNPGQTCDR